MAVIIYKNKAIIPGGFLDISKSYNQTGDGEVIGSVFNITLNGTLVAFKGSPTSSGTFWTGSNYPPDETPSENERLKSILTKQEALRDLFSDQGGLFEVQPWDGSAPIQFNPRIKSINFPNGVWFDRSDYVVEMEADLILGLINPSGEDSLSPFISDANENWSLEFNDGAEGVNHPNTYVLTHTVEAVGKRFYNFAGTLVKPAWQQARDWVLPRLGLDPTRITSSGVLNLPSYYKGFNEARAETVGENDGSYSVTETWILSSGSALEDFSISVQTGQDTGRSQVTIEGNIQGFEIRGSGHTIHTTKWTNALAKFNEVEPGLLARATTYSETSLNSIPVSRQVGKNPVTGNINYSVSYDNRPASLISNSLSESIVINDIYPADIFASIFVLGRANGPVNQDLGTVTNRQRELSIEVVMNAVGDNNILSGRPNYDSVISAAQPAGTVFVASTSETWDSKNKRGSRRITWVWQ